MGLAHCHQSSFWPNNLANHHLFPKANTTYEENMLDGFRHFNLSCFAQLATLWLLFLCRWCFSECVGLFRWCLNVRHFHSTNKALLIHHSNIINASLTSLICFQFLFMHIILDTSRRCFRDSLEMCRDFHMLVMSWTSLPDSWLYHCEDPKGNDPTSLRKNIV